MKPETILEQLFFTTVHVTDNNGSMGTGFFYAVPVENGTATFVVTNKHVVDGASSLTLKCRLKRADGTPDLENEYPVTFSDFGPSMWFGHPNPDVDVALIPISPLLDEATKAGKPLYFLSMSPELMPTEAQIAELDAVVDVRFVGYPNGLFDSKNALPIVRKGTTASYLQVDYDGTPAFLIDASVFPGSSGSPVLLVETGARSDRHGNVIVGQPIVYLLGIVAAMKLRTVVGELVNTTTKVVSVAGEGIDLGIVYKSRTIDELVDKVLENHGIKRVHSSTAAVTMETAVTEADKKIAETEE